MRAGGSGRGPFVVVISGAPGPGKTTLGWQLSRRLHVPVVSRDDIKTGMNVTHGRRGDAAAGGADGADGSWRFAHAAFATFYEITTQLVTAGVSVVIEAAFHSDHAPADLHRLAQHGSVLHVAVETPTAVALRRYRVRAERGERHPAHDDLRFAAEMESGVKDVSVYRLDLDVPTLRVDGSDGWSPPLEEIARFVEEHR